MILESFSASSIASSPSTTLSFLPSKALHPFNGQNTRVECPYFFSIPAASDPIVTGSPIRVISAFCRMRFCRYRVAGSACCAAEAPSVTVEYCSIVDCCVVTDCCVSAVHRAIAVSNAFEISSASHWFGVPITYGILYLSQRTFAARSPTADTTRLTTASPAFCRVSRSSPIAHVDKTFHPYFFRFSFNTSTFSCGPKSSGVTPNIFTLRKEDWSFFCLSGSLTNRRAICSSAIPAP